METDCTISKQMKVNNNSNDINNEKDGCEINDDDYLIDKIINNKNENNFIVKYKNNKYDISDFLKRHPGGSQILKSYKGLTLDKVLADIPHSTAAFHLFNEFRLDNIKAYEDIENLIDWNKPLLRQVGSLADRYWEWVNLPVNRSIRIFQSDYLELLTVTPWYFIPIVWIPIFIYFLYSGIINNLSSHLGNSLLIFPAFILGLILWSILEYTLHRHLFHLKPPPNSKILISLHFLLHGLHHKAPFDNRRLVFPPIAGVIIAIIFYQLYLLIFPTKLINIIAAGTTIGYLSYDLIHYYLHHGAPPPETYLYDMKRYHNYHHFSHHETGFGISSKCWDILFGTLIVLRQLKKAIIW